ncbi:Cytochrome b2, mitochondrial [Sphaceloma murrayae]|uniref:L-lactate dehydrogenase (cytochrome) n=1 Tax=Sphaceloma murrayae TaxID=2082308 RepID=A0A2K1QZI6_9PEZI|nr:Cytochrome b2, mitochondrial [Sphaceloma murrayae]
MGKVYTFDEGLDQIPPPPLNAAKLTPSTVQQHRSADSCWVILYGNVYDVTSFIPSHPGGSKIILQLAGTDATEEYDPIHPPGTLEESLPAEAKLGSFDTSTLPAMEKSPVEQGEVDEEGIPPLEDMLNLDDIEAAATKQLSRKAWAYYFSAADDLRSKSLNNTVYSSILLRPRIFVDCTRCDTSTTLLGYKVKVPFYVSPAAMARLGHPDGEHGIARACDTYKALQIISNNASQTPEQIVEGASPDQIFGWQLYVQTERKKSVDMLARIHKLPSVKFICLTLDAPVPGKREHDERTKNVGGNLPIRAAVQDGSASSTKPSSAAAQSGGSGGGGGVGKALFAGTAPDLTWKTTLPWLKKHTDLPIVLKGIQTHEDAYMASLHAPLVKAIILSNHGGRAADTAPPAVHTLIEMRKYCPEVFDKIEVWVDGGIKRGTDVVKALCLGARAVGMGRAPLYGLGAGGQAGVERVLEIIKAETKTTMRLLGAEQIDQLGPQHVNARAVERDVYDGPAGLEKLGMWLQSKL